MLPLFLNLAGRPVVVVGTGPVAESKRRLLWAAGAAVTIVDPHDFRDEQLDGAWLVVTAADADVNARVARAAEARRVFVNAADDPAHATAYLTGVVERDGVTVAFSTEGAAPGLTGLLREALDALLPGDVGQWLEEAKRQRAIWRRDGVPLAERRPILLEALNRLYPKGVEASAK
jgi:uroporphyrin-III C-methyltransferase/precorrin-2 dehydrogenase/sirohydrochlorin ferrochelatase